jgi:hypothetical protein
MPETPDFEQFARGIVDTLLENGGYDFLRPDGKSKALAQAGVAEQLRLVWNARGAADIATIEVEIPNVWTSAEPAGPLTRALRSLDR